MAMEGVGSQRNREENQDTPVQDLVQPVLLYGWETWKITKTGERKLNSFCASCATFLFSPHFDFICDFLLKRRRATWKLTSIECSLSMCYPED